MKEASAVDEYDTDAVLEKEASAVTEYDIDEELVDE